MRCVGRGRRLAPWGCSGAVLAAAVGCADVGGTEAAILNGTPSSRGSLAVRYEGTSGCLATAVYLDARHFLGAGCEGPQQWAVLGSVRSPTEMLRAVDQHIAPMGISLPTGGEDLRLTVFVTGEPTTAGSAPLPDGLPMVGDEVVMAGWGTGAGPTEGAVLLLLALGLALRRRRVSLRARFVERGDPSPRSSEGRRK